MNLQPLQNYSLFERYVKDLPERRFYARHELLSDTLLLYREKSLVIYYAPTDYINSAASVILLGITPGWQQMERFYRTARTAILDGKDRDSCLEIAKQEYAFYGGMRLNLVAMLDDLKLPQFLGIKEAASLFGTHRNLIHTCSAIRYPVFIQKANYTGHTPSPVRHEAMLEIIHELLLPELLKIHNALIIPLGNAVTSTLEYLISEKLLASERCCFGFPHPSGANGHRLRQFQENRGMLCHQITQWFQVPSQRI